MMKNFELDTKKLKSITYFSVVIFIIGVIFWDVFYRTNDRFYNNLLDSIRNEEYRGVVMDKYFDKENHNDPTLELKSGEKVSVYGIVWGKINVGDSIVKNKGETILQVFRNDKKMIFDNKDIVDGIRKSKEKTK